jgi:alkaline phosphatase
MHKGFFAGLMLALLCPGCAGIAASRPAPAARLPAAAIERPQQETPEWWFRAGAVTAHELGAGRERARNLILFVGDGMSLTTVAAARIFEGQARGQPGEENQLSFEQFPYTALSKTYNTDSQTPDSAGTMTALVTGVKTRLGMLSVGQRAERGDCAASVGQGLVTVLELAEAAGLATGVVTTTRITHATPGATYAHTPERDWESDGELTAPARAGGCRDIARQFAEFDVGDGIEVALGGGRGNFLAVGETDPEYPGTPGKRLDGRDLTREWRQRYPQGSYVWNQHQLAALDLARTPRLLGLFEPDHMNYEHDRGQDRAGEPSLAQMTRAAIGVLKHNPRGFFLMVEGGRIDHAHHAGNAYRALDETVAFSAAIRAAAEATSASDTLIVVTADHSHTLSFAGYQHRGNPILGKVRGASSEDRGAGLALDALGLPYTSLSYANGPGYPGASARQAQGAKKFPHIVSAAKATEGRPDLSLVDTEAADYLQESTLPTRSETHGGDDVGVWARGPGAAAVHGSLEQNVIFHLLVQAQPRIVQLLCRLGACEQGVPVKLPEAASLPRRR